MQTPIATMPGNYDFVALQAAPFTGQFIDHLARSLPFDRNTRPIGGFTNLVNSLAKELAMQVVELMALPAQSFAIELLTFPRWDVLSPHYSPYTVSDDVRVEIARATRQWAFEFYMANYTWLVNNALPGYGVMLYMLDRQMALVLRQWGHFDQVPVMTDYVRHV